MTLSVVHRNVHRTNSLTGLNRGTRYHTSRASYCTHTHERMWSLEKRMVVTRLLSLSPTSFTINSLNNILI